MVTIVFSHPWHGSFNKAILDTITTKLTKDNKAYEVIDLQKDNFNANLTEAELAVFNKGEALDPLVHKYQDILKKTDEIIFIFPIWWGTAPAILKGFFDKVLLVNFAYNYENGWTPLLNISKGTVISTSQGATELFKNSIENVFIPNMLNSVGINNVTWLNNDNTSLGTDEHRKAFLNTVEKAV
ncbi:MAG: NAD(P)H-dependent oxidoreductase [Dysgonomonas sp.]|uniref:NAD(P)H-dependent oxidoreductase n=1 Tax=Dysgonomonas TaxID=156973 RepID=UPI00333E62E2